MIYEGKASNYEMALRQAKDEYVGRQNRTRHPDGSFDRAGRFYSSEKEGCCNSIRTPSRAYPLSEMRHCRSMKHVANLFDVDVADLRKILKEG